MRKALYSAATLGVFFCGLALGSLGLTLVKAQPEGKKSGPPRDAIAEAQVQLPPSGDRPEQKKTAHDRSGVFAPANAPRSSRALRDQPEMGEFTGFDFARDPLNAKRPLQSF